jgi:hypothetical protein
VCREVLGSLGTYSGDDEIVPEKSYIRECQETSLSIGSVPILFCLGIQPNWLKVHSHFESGLAQA